MKHIRLTAICLCLTLAGGLKAQTPPEKKSVATIITEALAQLPADTPGEYDRIMTELTATGEEGLLDLIGRMNPPGKESNAALDFAVSGWIHFTANDSVARSVATGALEKALGRPSDRETKAFLIRRLATVAGDDNVETLSAFLTDEYLSDPAARALASVGTEKAGDALLAALAASDAGEVRLNLVNAVGLAGCRGAEPVLLSLLKENPSETMRKALLNALGNAGAGESLKALGDAAGDAGYAYRKDNAAASFISLLGRLNRTGLNRMKKEVEREAEKLLGRKETGIAAAKLLLEQYPSKREDILKNAIRDGGDITFLSGVLNLYPFQDDRKATELIRRALASAKSPETQTALVYWLGNHDQQASVSQIIRLADSPSGMVQKAVTLSLARLGGEEAMTALATLLKSDSEETVALAKNALLAFDGDISPALDSVFEHCGDTGKRAVMELIAGRGMKSRYDLVVRQLSADNATVRSAAAGALKEVVTDSHLPDLFRLLEASDEALIPAVQQAISAALDCLPASEQTVRVAERMESSPKKHLYYTALANSGSQEAMEMITQAYASAAGAEKAAALDALTRWKSFRAVGPLLDIARGTEESREKVTNALISLIRNSGETGAVKYLYLREAMLFARTDRQKNEILRLTGSTGQYQAMLFAASRMDEPALKETAAVAAMNIAIGNPSFAGTETTRILNRVSETLSNPDADYQRQAIARYLAENPAEGGFISLFNGKDLTGWKGLVENPVKRAKMSPRELAAAQVKADREMAGDWKVEEGNIIFDGKGYNNLCTGKQYGDFEMLADWKLYPGPEPDAGIYLRGTPQVQIWDTARVKAGAQVGSGGLYNNLQNPNIPLKVADQRVGEWNTFFIRMTGERVSVWLNGELVTDNVVLENYWDRSQPVFPVEQIELQAHGSKVAYRDIYIRELPSAGAGSLSDSDAGS
ncbi:MAG: DUF1080 domain-containing protein [Proteiniphilum sp.]|nr:DUF1080 domain-containing protein [Proteiniphilum sp.]